MSTNSLYCQRLSSDLKDVDTCFIRNFEDGYSLIEILVVITVIVVIMTLTWGTFYSLHNTMIVRQSSENLKTELINIQRAAMFIAREEEDNWIKGIGVDLSGLLNRDLGDPDSLEYRKFKWCSSSDQFDDISGSENLPSGYNSDCSGSGKTSFDGKEFERFTGEDLNFNTAIAGNGDSIDDVRYIVFEAVSGRPFLYQDNGGTLERTAFSAGMSLMLYMERNDTDISVMVRGNGNIVLDSLAELPSEEAVVDSDFRNRPYMTVNIQNLPKKDRQKT